MSRLRRAALGLAVSAVVLGLLEWGAMWVEHWSSPARRYPTPAPGLNEDFKREAAAARDAAGIPMTTHPSRGWALAQGPAGEGGPSINRDGLRGPELRPKQAGVLRIFTLGDSSVYGYGVEDEEVFSSVAARELRARLGRDCEAVNGATPGYSSEQSLSVLRQLGARVGPDWVVIANLWSDLYDRNTHNNELIDGVSGLSAAREGLARLAAYRLLRRALSPLLRSRRVAFAAEKGDLAGVQGTRSSLPTYILALRAMGEESRRLGAEPLYLTLPAPMDEDPAGVPETVALFREAQRQVAADLGAPHVDGVEVFDQEGLGIGAFLDQVHPAAQGHRALGLALAEALVRAEGKGEAEGR